MATNSRIQIGILSPATPNRPHFRSLDGILPAGVSIAHEGLGLLGESYQDLAGKEDVIVARAHELVNKHKVAGLMLTGGFVTLFNPGIEAKVADATGLPVVSAISSATAALTAFGAKSVLLMTPFDHASNEGIKTHVDKLGFTLYLGPAFDNRIPRHVFESQPGPAFQSCRRNVPKNSGAGDLFSRRNHGPAANHSAH
jgi:maleate cis-trans isomerase